MKSFAERNPVVIGIVGVTAVAAITLAALNYQKLPGFNQGTYYSAEFGDSGGLFTGAAVEVSGYPAGKVSSIDLDGNRVVVEFWVDRDIHVGDRSEARIRAKSLLGTKVLEVFPRGEDPLEATIPLDRTTSPYQLPDALGDLATTIGGLNTAQLSESLSTLANTFADTPEELRGAVQGVARIAQTLNERDAGLRELLENAATATGVLAKRTDQVVSLIKDSNALLAELRTQSAALDQIWNSVSAAARELKGFIEDNREELRPALDKLNGALTILDDRKERVQLAIKGLNTYAMSLGESISSGPFFKAYVVNLLPGQFVQPFIDAAFSDLGLDPSVLLPSQLTDPQTGQPATPALPVPYPRTGQGGEPHLTLPEAITGNQDPNVPAQSPGRYPYREPLPAPPPSGPPPGPPAPPPPELTYSPEPTPSPVFVPAPDEWAPIAAGDRG
ncbi:MCE family protein [Mycolicibacterium sp. OfavD-34-C]|uniref:MCE family protein n=1 Tax=Mycolicibacterium sp. OfavD-34-C TaxID=2917746 RepID=UPI001EF490A0|nr:MCE family protein [Mycolicibacterium sp. OfavD-34-C]MCG7579403.1 MCE family protein [Mycolicibacterium sp. OfavD-34-C]